MRYVEVHIREVATGRTGVYQHSYDELDKDSFHHIEGWWSWGNGSCDCNRAHMIDFEAEDPDVECSDGLYVVDKIVVPETGEVLYSEK